MKLIPLEFPILESPDPQAGLLLAILGEICRSNRYFEPTWIHQTSNDPNLMNILVECVENGLFRSNRKCVVQMTLHILTLTLNQPQILSLITTNRALFNSILEQLETIPSNRFYSDGVLFKNPKIKPKYNSALGKWVRVFHLWVDIVKPEFGQLKFASRFDLNYSTGKYSLNNTKRMIPILTGHFRLQMLSCILTMK